MKKLLFNTIAFALAAITVLGFSGCKKTKKGVLEIRNHSILAVWSPDGTIDHINGVYDEFKCVVVDGEIDLKDGEIVSSAPGYVYNANEYIYHSSESAKSLGYTQKEKESGVTTPYGTYEYYFVSEDKGPGKNSGFSRIAGQWIHRPTGLKIWIDNDRDGKAFLVEGGTSAPKEAVGGYAWREINNSGDNSYSFHNQIYYPNQGWVDGSYMSLEMSEDGQSFTVGGATYERI